MSLESAVCILAAANVIICLFSILCCYSINQLSIRNLNEARTANQNATASALLADKYLSMAINSARAPQ